MHIETDDAKLLMWRLALAEEHALNANLETRAELLAGARSVIGALVAERDELRAALTSRTERTGGERG